MIWLYTFGIRFYTLGIIVVGFFIPKAKLWWQGRKERAYLKFNHNNKNVAWFHCASLGEFDQGLPLMREYRKRHPAHLIFVTFFSPSGITHYNKRNHPVDFACYLPVDTPSKAKKFIAHIQPSIVFFVKYEFWANHLFELQKNGIPSYSVSAIFRKNQTFFRFYGSFDRKILKSFKSIFVQNQSSLNLLKSVGIESGILSGDLRFENVLQAKKKFVPNEKIEAFSNDRNALILGSSWPRDEEFIIPVINEVSFEQKVIIAPHDISEKHLVWIEKRITKKLVRYSSDSKLEDADVLLIDSIGQLSSAYNYGSIAYVGGGQTGSLHNILEPAAYGLPTIFGPKHSKFPEAHLFLQKEFAREASNEVEFREGMKSLNKHGLQLSREILSFMESTAGLSKEILDEIETE
jgi:3-deoxy-D-manno-octulosonic-acid transferase